MIHDCDLITSTFLNSISSLSTMSARHIPYLSFHKSIIREICRPQKDDLLIIAKGLGLRRVGDWPLALTPDRHRAPQDVRQEGGPGDCGGWVMRSHRR